jgi:hypothetical protein
VLPLVYLTAKALLWPAPQQAPAEPAGTGLESPLFTETVPAGSTT